MRADRLDQRIAARGVRLEAEIRDCRLAGKAAFIRPDADRGGGGLVIDDEKEVSAYPVQKETQAPFVEADWDLATMEPKSGLYPGQKGPIQERLSERDQAMRK